MDDKVHNLRGQVLNSYDGAGKHYVDGYDFKGMPLAGYLQLLADATISDANWSHLSDSDLSSEVFTTSVVSDALGRRVSATDAGGNITAHTYGKDGALKTVTVNGDAYVQDIRHNAKGQREAIWYGNGTKTGYTYDALSNRLSRLLTVDVDSSHSNYNESLQDLSYTYDAVGNIIYITDSAQQAVFYNNSYVPPDQDYTYDSLYRLVMAGGRELKGLASVTSFGSGDNTDDRYWMNSPQPGDGTAMQNYLQKYEYDKAGNMRTLKHIANTGSYTRSFGVAHTNNQLTGSDAGIGANAATGYSYNYDARGNMTSMPHLSVMSYDALNQMVYVEPGNDKVFYQYSGGQRIRKRIEKAGGLEIRIYLGGYEVYRKWDSAGNLTLERTTVHVGDDSGRIGMIEARTVGSDGSPALLKRFIYSNHLQSAALEVDENGSIISYEEYHPYGTTSYQAMDVRITAIAKRYRYTGKERDEESGLNYHGARYYAPWLCRWCAVDPLESKYTPWSSYCYLKCNPINDTDSTGMGGDEDTIVVANVTGIRSINSSQMLDGLRIARDEINNRVAHHQRYEAGQESSIKSLSPHIAAYAEAHHLTGDQTADFQKVVNNYYNSLATLALWNFGEYQKLDKSVISKNMLPAYQTLSIVVGRILEAQTNLTIFMEAATHTAMFVAFAEVMPSAGKPPSAPRFSSETQEKLVSLELKQTNNVNGDIVFPRIGKTIGELTIEKGGKFSQSEMNAARYLRLMNKDVTLRIDRGARSPSGSTSDLVDNVTGETWDVYTPRTASLDRVVNGIRQKNDQAQNIVVDLSHTSLDPIQLSNAFTRVRNAILSQGRTMNIKSIHFIKYN